MKKYKVPKEMAANSACEKLGWLIGFVQEEQ